MPRMPLRRPRAAIAAAGGFAVVATAVAVALAGCGLVGPSPVSTVGRVAFDTPLAIPPLAPSELDAEGTRVFALEAQAGITEFAPGVPSETWGFDGSFLGPTLVADRGERVRIDVTNALDEPTSVHWHGMHLPAPMDGGPHQPVEPGQTWSPSWVIDQPAATLWYHPHPHGETESHVRRGLAGMFLLRDPDERALGLPSTYGVDDLPVIVQDTGFSADGRREDPRRTYAGGIGDELIVNGTRGPYVEVADEVVRLRLLNASTARSYGFEWSDGRPVRLIATDGGLLESSVELPRIVLSPGERAEILVEVRPGERAVLRSALTAESLGMVDAIAATNGDADAFDVLEVRAAASLRPSAPIPDVLADVPAIGDEEIATTRSFRLGDSFEINGEAMRMDRIDEVVEAGRAERWVVENDTDLPHSFHVHDVQFQIASIGGSPPPPELSGWKDTVRTRPHTEYELRMRFEDYADPEHPYMYHCHLLWHEDQGMMGQFVVVGPGQRATMTEETHHDH